MDLYCPKCGDPLDNDYLHDVVSDGDFPDYKSALHAFQSQGCKGLSMPCNPNGNKGKAMAMDALYDLLGDDADGAAAMMEDYGYMFD